jgi:zinc/manganese transport system permease protein
MNIIFADGFFTSGPVLAALAVGGFVAVVTAVVGVFTVIRGQSFAGHALADLGAVGGSAAFLIGISQVWGFVGAGILAAILMEAVGIKRVQGRDVATGIVFGLGLGLTALFLYLDTTISNSSNAAISVLFGSLFVINTDVVPLVIVLSILALIITVAISVELSSLTIGAILSTALLIGPAASALRITKRAGRAVLVAAAIGLASTWAGIVLSYDSYYWFNAHHNWPVSFCIVAIVFVVYLVTGAATLHHRVTRRAKHPAPPEPNVAQAEVA